MSAFVVVVDFELTAGAGDAFRDLVAANARASARTEPGCRRFDVVELDGPAGRVLLYEIYDDEAAFRAHCGTAHFAAFDAASAPLVVRKTVLRGTLTCEGGATDD